MDSEVDKVDKAEPGHCGAKALISAREKKTRPPRLKVRSLPDLAERSMVRVVTPRSSAAADLETNRSKFWVDLEGKMGVEK